MSVKLPLTFAIIICIITTLTVIISVVHIFYSIAVIIYIVDTIIYTGMSGCHGVVDFLIFAVIVLVVSLCCKTSKCGCCVLIGYIVIFALCFHYKNIIANNPENCQNNNLLDTCLNLLIAASSIFLSIYIIIIIVIVLSLIGHVCILSYTVNDAIHNNDMISTNSLNEFSLLRTSYDNIKKRDYVRI